MEISLSTNLLLVAVALLYSSVGHAGASGYIAVLTLAGLSAASVRPLALVLNILVASIASVRFYRAGYFRPRLFWPLAALAIPCAALGGAAHLPMKLLARLIGATLLCSAVWMMWKKREPETPQAPSARVLAPIGALLGMIAGLTGTGGGIFLSPTMIFLRWARIKEVAATAALFILVNSIAGLIGLHFSGQGLPPGWPWCLAAVAVGGAVGSTMGAKHFPPRGIQTALAFVLIIAGWKLLFV